MRKGSVYRKVQIINGFQELCAAVIPATYKTAVPIIMDSVL